MGIKIRLKETNNISPEYFIVKIKFTGRRKKKKDKSKTNKNNEWWYFSFYNLNGIKKKYCTYKFQFY